MKVLLMGVRASAVCQGTDLASVRVPWLHSTYAQGDAQAGGGGLGLPDEDQLVPGGRHHRHHK